MTEAGPCSEKTAERNEQPTPRSATGATAEKEHTMEAILNIIVMLLLLLLFLLYILLIVIFRVQTLTVIAIFLVQTYRFLLLFIYS